MTICIISTQQNAQRLYTAGRLMMDAPIQVLQTPSAQDLQYDIQHTATYLLPHVRFCTRILMAGDDFWHAVLSYMAIKLNAPILSRIIGGTPSGFLRYQYGGAVISTVHTDADIICASVNVNHFDAHEGDIPITILPIPDKLGENTVDISPVQVSKTLATAKKVIVVGGAVTSPQDIDTIGTIAHYIGADIGATTPVVTAGLLPPHTLVGTSGVQIAPDIYIGIGVSGAVHHLSGIRGAKTIIAVNVDADAPLCQIADYIVNGDYHSVLESLQRVLS